MRLHAAILISLLALNTHAQSNPFDISAKMDFEVFGKVLTVWKSEQV